MIGVIPETVKEAVQNWDNNEPIFTVEMGGLGPGYEQCIHIATFELMRRFMDAELPQNDTEAFREWYQKEFSDALREINEKFGLGMSGAQAGAAKNLAYSCLNRGYKATIELFPQDRRIQVSKHWPKG